MRNTFYNTVKMAANFLFLFFSPSKNYKLKNTVQNTSP